MVSRRPTKAAAFAMIVVTMASAALVAQEPSDPTARQAFIAEYAAYGNALASEFAHFRVRSRTTFPSTDGGAFIQEIEGKVANGNYLYEVKTKTLDPNGKPIGAGTIGAGGSNSKYSFDVDKKGESKWAVSAVNTHSAPRTRRWWSIYTCPFSDPFHRKTFVEMAHDANTEIIAFRESQWQGRAVREWKVRYVNDEGWRVECGYFFDPGNHWVCVGYQAASSRDGRPVVRTNTHYQYHRTDAGTPRLSRIEMFTNQPDPEKMRLAQLHEVFEYIPVAPIPEEEFRLSRFGIPEPVGVTWEEPRSRTWLWITLAAVGAFILAGIFRWARNRAMLRNKP